MHPHYMRLCALGALGLQGFPVMNDRAEAARSDAMVGAYVGVSFGGDATELLYGLQGVLRVSGDRECEESATGGYGQLGVRLGAAGAFRPEMGLELGGGLFLGDENYALGSLLGLSLHFDREPSVRTWGGLEGRVEGVDFGALLSLQEIAARVRLGSMTQLSDLSCSTSPGLVMDGRPLRIDGKKAPLPAVEGQTDVDPKVGDWVRAAQTEWGSVASFMVVRAQLAALAAPSELLADYVKAAEDEYYHALGAGALVVKSGAPSFTLGPPLTETSLQESGLASIATEAFWDGCVGEGVAARYAKARSVEAEDEAVADYLSLVADEEATHAALAWRTIEWALAQRDPMVTSILEDAVALEIEIPADTPVAEHYRKVLVESKLRLKALVS